VGEGKVGASRAEEPPAWRQAAISPASCFRAGSVADGADEAVADALMSFLYRVTYDNDGGLQDWEMRGLDAALRLHERDPGAVVRFVRNYRAHYRGGGGAEGVGVDRGAPARRCARRFVEFARRRERAGRGGGWHQGSAAKRHFGC
jgi:hypothetical protein